MTAARSLVAAAFAATLLASPAAGAESIHADSALSPGLGRGVYRAQLRYRSMRMAGGDVDSVAFINVVGYGVHRRLALFVRVPFVLQDGTVGDPPAEVQEAGVADGMLMAKARLYERDRRGRTTRFAVVGGVELPSYDAPFSSESFDPVAGAVFTYQSIARSVDLVARWKFETADGGDAPDAALLDASYAHTLVTSQAMDDTIWQLRALIELNGALFTDDRRLVHASPGLMLSAGEVIVELSLQVPVVRDLNGAPEPGPTVAAGARYVW